MVGEDGLVPMREGCGRQKPYVASGARRLHWVRVRLWVRVRVRVRVRASAGVRVRVRVRRDACIRHLCASESARTWLGVGSG